MKLSDWEEVSGLKSALETIDEQITLIEKDGDLHVKVGESYLHVDDFSPFEKFAVRQLKNERRRILRELAAFGVYER